MANSAKEKLCATKKQRINLTPIGLLMEGDSARLRRLFTNIRVGECYRDVTPTDFAEALNAPKWAA